MLANFRNDGLPSMPLDEDVKADAIIGETHLDIVIAAHFKRYGRSQLVVDAADQPLCAVRPSRQNSTLVSALVKSYRWNRQLAEGETTIAALAAAAGLSRTYVSRVVNLMLLSPRILTAILKGEQPETLQLQDLLQNLPLDWQGQETLLRLGT